MVTVPRHDAQYTKEEYADRIGWGHCSVEHAVFASMTGAQRLLLFHHDPFTDDDLDAHCEAQQRALRGNGAPPELRLRRDADRALAPALAVRCFRRWRVVEHEVGGVVIRVVAVRASPSTRPGSVCRRWCGDRCAFHEGVGGRSPADRVDEPGGSVTNADCAARCRDPGREALVGWRPADVAGASEEVAPCRQHGAV